MKSKKRSDEDYDLLKPFAIAAIGAAAGGVDAMMEFLFNLPDQTGIAYIYVQHPDAGSDGNLVETLRGASAIPVAEATDELRLEPDHLYLISPGQFFILADGTFRKSDPPEEQFEGMPMNLLCDSLAKGFREASIAILLSGNITDGTQGLKAIKMAGGITLAQSSSARFQTMPRSAIADGAVDLVLTPAEIGSEMQKIGSQTETYFSAIRELDEETISSRDEDLLSIIHLLHRATGVDFGQYKMNTVKRRVIRRMMLHKLENLKDYAHYIRQQSQEVHLLYQDLLINVTQFFRDGESSEHMRSQLLPRILKLKPPNEPIRVWVAACSTGQEAYSLAMLIVETLGEMSTNIPIQIFATDLSEMAINKARLGIYSKDEVAGIPTRRLQRFFLKMDGHYRIVKSIRDLCVFANHNIVKDPPFSRLDIISCCNLLIYLDSNLQKKLIATFHYSLNANGYLVLGKSETVGTSAYLFNQLDKKLKIYTKKKDTAAKAMFEMTYRQPPEADRNSLFGRKTEVLKNKADEMDLERAVDELLLKRYTPASVLVNYELDILQFRGSTGLFLEPAPGKASLNLMKMARPGLGFELRNIVHKARKTGQPARKSGLEINLDGKSHRVSIEAVPTKTHPDEDYYLVVFTEMPQGPAESELGSIKDRRVKQLETELAALREDMRSIVEAQEAANEELQSANEEIVSSNEELQSINEELETSKEEIESSNEELITINQELQVRNEQLAEVQEYSEAVFTTIREALLILDKDLRVKTANNSFYKTFQMKEEDVEGRQLFELANRQWNIPELRRLLEEIIPANTHFYGFEVVTQFAGIGEKVLVMNARRVVQKIHRQQVVLLAIEDITEHREAQRIVTDREAWFRNMADNAPVMIWVTGRDHLSTFVNKAFLEFRGLKKDEVLGKTWLYGCHPDDFDRCNTIYEQSFNDKTAFEFQYRERHRSGGYRWLLTRAKPNFTPEGQFIGFIGSCVEVDKEA